MDAQACPEQKFSVPKPPQKASIQAISSHKQKLEDKVRTKIFLFEKWPQSPKNSLPRSRKIFSRTSLGRTATIKLQIKIFFQTPIEKKIELKLFRRFLSKDIIFQPTSRAISPSNFSRKLIMREKWFLPKNTFHPLFLFIRLSRGFFHN